MSQIDAARLDVLQSECLPSYWIQTRVKTACTAAGKFIRGNTLRALHATVLTSASLWYGHFHRPVHRR
jgi:hypothetical protein